MNHEKLHELLAPYALGILESRELQALEAHLGAGCAECREELRALEAAAGELAFSVPPVSPPPALRDRILSAAAANAGAKQNAEVAGAGVQVWKSWAGNPPSGSLSLVRAGEGAWEPVGAMGVSVKRLSYDPERRLATMLVRMLPGASYPSHRHSIAEECYVIEGDLHVGDLVMRAGDFQRAEASSVHVTQRTESGCVRPWVSVARDMIVKAPGLGAFQG